VVAAWLLLGAAGLLARTHLDDVTAAGQTSFLPADSESTRAVEALPLGELVQIGATVAFGVLLDTFVVRALLTPAITYRLGDRAWWPGWARERPRPGRQ
jgi:MMPL family protein